MIYNKYAMKSNSKKSQGKDKIVCAAISIAALALSLINLFLMIKGIGVMDGNLIRNQRNSARINQLIRCENGEKVYCEDLELIKE